MAEAVVTIALQQLETITGEAKFLFGIDDKVNAAKVELRRMCCFLKDADKRARGSDELVRNWVDEIREITYDLEDAILIYEEKVIPRRRSKVLKRIAYLPMEVFELHRIGSKIQRITTRISNLRESLVTYGIRDLSASREGATSSSTNMARELRRQYSHVVEHDVVGINADIEKLVAVFVEDENVPTPRVVSICGMGGLGKTTLARKVYQHRRIRNHFDRLAWASISQQCNVSGVWKEILLKLCPEDRENINQSTMDSEICGKLHRLLKERKCLIVLDDIWTSEIWDCLSPAFPRGETRSRILITTRNKNLVLHADVNGLNHEPLCLSEDQSWELFEKVFTDSHTNLEDLENKKILGQELLKYCRGLPLAIIVLRGVMSKKETVSEWEDVRNNAKMYINDGKVTELQGFEHSGVSWVLGLSYDELPYQLKPCFLHLANFPEDHEIRVDQLCQMWMAEGLVASEDIAYEYFKELEQRCMVKRAAMSSFNGRIKTCRIHDLIRDLCLFKSQEENFVHSIKITKEDTAEDVKTGSLVSNKIRRISVMTRCPNLNQMVSLIRDHHSLRSFMITETIMLRMKTLKLLFKCFLMLRVLIFEAQPGTNIVVKIPKEIEKLVHLRLLSFKGCKLAGSLPSSISKLGCLKTLDLRFSDMWYDPLQNVAEWRLCQLINLYLPILKYYPYPDGNSLLRNKKLCLENSRNLRTLVGVFNSDPNFSQLALLTNLTKMEVLLVKDLDVCFTFNNLRSLTVKTYQSQTHSIVPIVSRCPKINKLKVDGRIVMLPKLSQFSAELVKLTLKDTEYAGDMMATLEKLPKLKILRLVNQALLDKVICCSKDAFPRLQSLYLSDLHIEEWRMEKGAFPVLRELTLDRCLGFYRVLPHFEDHPALKVNVI